MMGQQRHCGSVSGRVGLLAVGHHTYWGQFDGLRDELVQKVDVLRRRIESYGTEVVPLGLVDQAEGAYAVLPAIKAADLDLLFIDMVTYATSATFGVLARELNIPIVLVALQPMKAMDYARATTYMQLCNDDLCSVPEFSGVAVRLGRKAPPLILGTLDDDPAAEEELSVWCAVAGVLHRLRHARIGLMGHVLEAMLDMHSDPTALTATFGCHFVLCEVEELVELYRGVAPETVATKRREILGLFDTPDPKSDPTTERVAEHDLEMAARVAVALDAFVTARKLDGLAYYYEGLPASETRAVVSNLIVGNSLLCADGFPMCGEYDAKTCVAMMIMDGLGIGGSFAEFHPVDYQRDSVLVGHDGPHHIAIAEGRPVLRSLKKYHGKPGSGASVEFCIRRGPISLLSIGLRADGRPKFVIAEGESIEGPIPPTGNTNTHGRFAPNVRSFLKRWIAEGPTHHFALGVGHHARALSRVADCLGIEWSVVTPHGELL